MASESEVLLKLIDEKSTVQVLSGFYRGLDGDRATVDFANGRVPAYFTSAYMPAVNDPVWVMVADGVAYMLGPTTPKPAEGLVLFVTDGVVTVDTPVGQVLASHNVGQVLTAGDRVKLHWSDGCHVLGVVSVAAQTPDVPPPAGGGTGRVTKTFTAVDSGTRGNSMGWWTNDVRNSASNQGGWFYGNKIRDTIPDSAVIEKAEIYLPLISSRFPNAPFGRHGFASKPSGALSFSDTSELPSKSGWVRIPNSLINHLKANAGGLGFTGGTGDSTWAGTQKDAQSGAVRVTYTS